MRQQSNLTSQQTDKPYNQRTMRKFSQSQSCEGGSLIKNTNSNSSLVFSCSIDRKKSQQKQKKQLISNPNSVCLKGKKKIDLSKFKHGLIQCIIPVNHKFQIKRKNISFAQNLNVQFNKTTFISSQQLENHAQIINQYNQKVFNDSPKFKRFSKLLKNKFYYQLQRELSPKKQIKQGCFDSPNLINNNQSKLTKKSKLDQQHQNRITVNQMFTPKLKHKKRPSSGVPLKKFNQVMMLKKRNRSLSMSQQISMEFKHIDSLRCSVDKQIYFPIYREHSEKRNPTSKTRLMTEPIDPNYIRYDSNFIRYEDRLQKTQQIDPWGDDQQNGKKQSEQEQDM